VLLILITFALVRFAHLHVPYVILIVAPVALWWHRPKPSPKSVGRIPPHHEQNPSPACRTLLRTVFSAFGGGKVVLPSMHQAAVREYDWMTDQQFVDLFSISMAAPGPSMMVVTLVGLKACLPYGVAAAILGALVATLGMFVPSSVLVYFAGNWWDHWKESPGAMPSWTRSCPSPRA